MYKRKENLLIVAFAALFLLLQQPILSSCGSTSISSSSSGSTSRSRSRGSNSVTQDRRRRIKQPFLSQPGAKCTMSNQAWGKIGEEEVEIEEEEEYVVSTTLLSRRKSLSVAASARKERQAQEKEEEEETRAAAAAERLLRHVQGGGFGFPHLCCKKKRAGNGKQSSSSKTAVEATASAEAAAEEERRVKTSTLWTVKLLFLLFYGSLGSVMPYLPVYYHSLGLPGLSLSDFLFSMMILPLNRHGCRDRQAADHHNLFIKDTSHTFFPFFHFVQIYVTDNNANR